MSHYEFTQLCLFVADAIYVELLGGNGIPIDCLCWNLMVVAIVVLAEWVDNCKSCTAFPIFTLAVLRRVLNSRTLRMYPSKSQIAHTRLVKVIL